MQKKLIALALASLAGTAFAQSNVTIYGVADATFDNVKAKGGAGVNTDWDARNRVTANSSYIGFKGVEDLGGGLKAVFQFENGLQFENAAGAWAGRDSFVGVAGGFGTIVAGNITGPTRALGAKLDINSGATGIGANTALLGKLGGGAGAGAFDQRLQNAVAYVSPNFSGFSGVVGYTSGLNTTAASGSPYIAAAGLIGNAKETVQNGTVGASNSGYTAGLNYENGPFYVGYAYTQVNVDDSAVVDKLRSHRLGGIAKFGPAQVGLLWDQTKADLNAVGANDLKQNVYYLSGKFNLGAGNIIAQYGWARDVDGTVADEKGRHYAVGYEHSLSKRTILKAVYAGISNENTTYDYLYGVSNANSTAVGGALAAGADPRGFSVGVRHSF